MNGLKIDRKQINKRSKSKSLKFKSAKPKSVKLANDDYEREDIMGTYYGQIAN